ncbi:MAG: GreA/GreB family elongation factor [Gammaproteobacteria bacterium]|nr:GreA/GreB family elongation factor [Gammaproteobacteria bacterium]
MAKKLFRLTQEEVDTFKLELEHLIDVERPQNVKQLEEARALGDLSENSDYDYAKSEQARINERIEILKKLTEPDNYELVEARVIKVEFVELGLVREYSIGGDQGSDVLNNKISLNSPLALACKDKLPGDVFDFYTEAGRKVTVKLLDNAK